jgi:hypothetical protein
VITEPEHPGVVIRPGPTGRRAALADGPDVWEVIAALNALVEEAPELDRTSRLRQLGEVTGLTSAQVDTALRYYTAHPREIAERIALNLAVSYREEQSWEVRPGARGRFT